MLYVLVLCSVSDCFSSLTFTITLLIYFNFNFILLLLTGIYFCSVFLLLSALQGCTWAVEKNCANSCSSAPPLSFHALLVTFSTLSMTFPGQEMLRLTDRWTHLLAPQHGQLFWIKVLTHLFPVPTTWIIILVIKVKIYVIHTQMWSREYRH